MPLPALAAPLAIEVGKGLLWTIGGTIAGLVAQKVFGGKSEGPTPESITARQENESRRLQSELAGDAEQEDRVARARKSFDDDILLEMSALQAGDRDAAIGMDPPAKFSKIDPEVLKKLVSATDPVQLQGPYGFLKAAHRRVHGR